MRHKELYFNARHPTVVVAPESWRLGCQWKKKCC